MALFQDLAKLAEELAGEPGRLKKRGAIAEAIRRVHDAAPASGDADFCKRGRGGVKFILR